MISINAKLHELAHNGEPQAEFTYGKELLSVVRNSSIDNH